MSATVEMSGPRLHMAHSFLSDRGELITFVFFTHYFCYASQPWITSFYEA